MQPQLALGQDVEDKKFSEILTFSALRLLEHCWGLHYKNFLCRIELRLLNV
jgi:hypothetical protein